MKIVFLDAKTLGDVPNLHLLEQYGTLTLYSTTRPEEVSGRISGAQVVITNKVRLEKEVLEKAKELKLICVAATGTNNIDLEAAAQLKIPVKNVANYSTDSVAQVTFALLLHLVNKIDYFDKYVKQGDYAQSDIFTHLGETFWEIRGKRFGIIGLGHIGRQVAQIAAAFGAEVVYYSTSGRNTDQPYLRLELRELLKTADVVSIHAPLNEHTQNLITGEELALMKSSALLINVGRGGIVNEADLAQALDAEVIGGAGLDVFIQEPIRSDNPLLQVQNKHKLVLTPHIAWASREARITLIERVSENIRDFLAKAPTES